MPANKFTINIGILLIVIFFGIFLSLQQSNTSPETDMFSTLPTELKKEQQNITLSPAELPVPTSDNATVSAKEAVLKTTKGDITISFFVETPRTVANFVQKANSKFYNNLTFHRVEDWVIQGGDPSGNGTGGGNMPVEFNDKPFLVGSVGVASRGDGKIQNDAQFFITTKEAEWLNGKYTNFGTVIKGIDVVNKIKIGDKILQIMTK